MSLKPGACSFPIKSEDILPLDLKSVWGAMEECQRLGLAKSIGVSNFTRKKIAELLQIAKIPPAVNQVYWCSFSSSNTIVECWVSNIVMRKAFVGGIESSVAAKESDRVLQAKWYSCHRIFSSRRPGLAREKKPSLGIRGAPRHRQGERKDCGPGCSFNLYFMLCCVCYLNLLLLDWFYEMLCRAILLFAQSRTLTSDTKSCHIISVYFSLQVSLRWIYEQGASMVVKSLNKERMKENMEIFDWELSEEDRVKISQIPQCKMISTYSLLSPQESRDSIDLLDVDIVDD
ncbi:hypothetical protein BHM03_00029026 [Ensete ventricosum]|nr:hypothetical protein BHM03_00029026 [Ensete ventricosum]